MAMPFMKSRRVIPLAIPGMFAIRYGIRNRLAVHSGFGGQPSPVLCSENKAVAALTKVIRALPHSWHHRTPRSGAVGIALMGLAALCPHLAGGTAPELSPPTADPAAIEQLTELMVEAP